MKHCKHCNDTLFTEIYDTCMTCYEKLLAFQSTCFEKQPTESTMTKTIDQYEGECLWYQREINALQATVNGDGFNIKRLTEENEKLRNELECYKKNGDVKSDVVKRQQEILDKILFELPVGNITSHTYENIPDRVAYYVKESAELGEIVEKLHLEKTKAVNDYLLLQVYAEEDAETLQSLEKAIKTHYEYYSGFAANKNLSSFQMLDTLFKSKPVYNRVDSKQNECLVDDNHKLHAELAKCIKDTMNIENERDECKKLAVEQYLHIEELDKENENNFQLIAKLIEERDRYQEDAVRLLARLGTSQERMIDAERERDKFQSVAQLLNYLHPEIASNQAEESARYKAALEEIVKRPRKSETCRLIAQQALGLLNDDEYQPELLIEENLKLKIKIEDLQAVIDSELLNKVFPQS